jgi:hypothetical protein
MNNVGYGELEAKFKLYNQALIVSQEALKPKL